MNEIKPVYPPAADVLPRQRDLYYGGQWHRPLSGSYFPVLNPATGEDLGEVAAAGQEDVDRCVAAAAEGAATWRATPPLQRAAAVRRIAQVVRDNAAELALLDALDGGNPVRAMHDIDIMISVTLLEFFAGLATEIKGETVPMGEGSLNYTLRQPLGVVVRIVPYNHPLMFVCTKMAAPLVAGNAVIIKPGEQTPLSALRLAELIDGILPPGVLSIVNGGRETGSALVAHPDVAAVSLVGSIPTGRAVLRGAADTIKRTLLELGGKNAMVIYPDADADKAAASAVHGINFGWTAGQSCGSITRVFIHESHYERVVDQVAERVAEVRLGLPSDPETQMGCLVNRVQYDKVLGYIERGRSEGARLLCGGGPPDDPALGNGFFVSPTVFADVTAEMAIGREEIFGPVLCLMKWSDEEVMMAQVNALEYGLTASIWTRDLATAHRAAARVEAGYVWINGSSSHFPGAPFGGFKQSGLGREECLEELLAYTEVKNVNVTLEP